MNINITGHQLEVTPAIREFTNNKFERLERHFDKITSIHVIFDVEKFNQIAEATMHVTGAELHARAVSENLYSAIDSLVDKLERQASKHKQKQNGRRD